jgi:hypothetical protein
MNKMRELFCNDCGTKLGDPIQSNIDGHIRTTGHKAIIEREMLLDDGTLASKPGVYPNEAQVAGVPEAKQELEEAKKTVPSKEEQKEIEELTEEKPEHKKSKGNHKKYY